MIGMSSNKSQKRKFKYYPRYHEDNSQAKHNSFAKGYREKKLDTDLHKNQSIKDGFHFKRSITKQKKKDFSTGMSVNLLLFMFLALLIYGIYWVLNNQDFFTSATHQWTT